MVKNTSLMYVIGYAELTTTALNISNLTLQTIEALTVLAFVYLCARLGAVGADPPARVPARAPGDPLMSTSARRWVIGVVLALAGGAIAVYALARGPELRLGRAGRPLHHLRAACRGRSSVSAIAVVGSALIGVTLGTLLTIKFLPLAGADPALHRGLPRAADPRHASSSSTSACPRSRPGSSSARSLATSIALILWGSAQVAEATRGAVQSIPREQHEAASALGFGWVGRHAFVILPQALRRLLPPLVSLLVNIIQNSTLAQVIGGLELLEAAERQNERITAIPPIGLGEIKAFQIFGFVMVLFFLISFPLTRLAA